MQSSSRDWFYLAPKRLISRSFCKRTHARWVPENGITSSLWIALIPNLPQQICAMTEWDWMSCSSWTKIVSIWTREKIVSTWYITVKFQGNQWAIHRHQLNAIHSPTKWTQALDWNGRRLMSSAYPAGNIHKRWDDATRHSGRYFACASTGYR